MELLGLPSKQSLKAIKGLERLLGGEAVGIERR
jgi:hypothetical protein